MLSRASMDIETPRHPPVIIPVNVKLGVRLLAGNCFIKDFIYGSYGIGL
jgi:hypothetical protein